MKLIRQPKGSSMCGQACVATIAGVSLEESIKAFGGSKGGTRTKQVVNALRKLGVACGDKLVRISKKNPKPSECMVVLRFDDCRYGHWTFYFHGLYFDPDIGIVKEYPEGVRETSYLPIFF